MFEYRKALKRVDYLETLINSIKNKVVFSESR